MDFAQDFRDLVEELARDPCRMLDKFPYRLARFEMEGGLMVVVDPHRPRMVTMDEWPALIFRNCDGVRTIREILDAVASAFEGDPPAGLDDMVLGQIDALPRRGLIALFDETITGVSS